jgi:hypothetical protein
MRTRRTHARIARTKNTRILQRTHVNTQSYTRLLRTAAWFVLNAISAVDIPGRCRDG